MSWKCPFCHQFASQTTGVLTYGDLRKSFWGDVGYRVDQTVCPNANCSQMELSIEIGEIRKIYSPGHTNYSMENPIKKWTILPSSGAKSLPSYIPLSIRQDYEESCLIIHLSPKASATLARRCLQGILRDFWEVKPDTLHKEILQIKGKIDNDIWEAIETVRKVGNIGAHMESNINVIVDVEPNEAELLTALIEDLIDNWYVKRHKQQERLASLKELANTKEIAKIKPESAAK